MADARTPGIQARLGGETPRQCWPRREGIVAGGGGRAEGREGSTVCHPSLVGSALLSPSVGCISLWCARHRAEALSLFSGSVPLSNRAKNNGYLWAVLCQAVHGTF